MKIRVKVEVELQKSKAFPACWEYTLNGRKYIVTPFELKHEYEPYDMEISEKTEYERIPFNPQYNKDISRI